MNKKRIVISFFKEKKIFFNPLIDYNHYIHYWCYTGLLNKNRWYFNLVPNFYSQKLLHIHWALSELPTFNALVQIKANPLMLISWLKSAITVSGRAYNEDYFGKFIRYRIIKAQGRNMKQLDAQFQFKINLIHLLLLCINKLEDKFELNIIE